MQGAQARSRPVLRQLPYALVATLLVVVAPPLVTALLISNTLLAIAVCVLLALGVSRGGDLLWRRLPQSKDVLFADLMLWGWLRRMRTERRLERAKDVFIPGAGMDGARRLQGLERVNAMIESRDAYTHKHSGRVTRYAEGIARRMGLPDDEVDRIRLAAALHDVGKYFTPREILNKPGKLTDEEFAVIKRHPGDGADLVKGLVDPEVIAMIRHHHERGTGRGYPDGLAGEAIPLGARIIAVADTFDAMTSTRAYRSARPHQRALDVLREEAGTALDAGAVAAFVAYYSGRRGQWVSSLAAGASQALREVVGPSVARVLPGLGTSVALTAPLLSATAPALSVAATEHHAVRHHRAVVERVADVATATPNSREAKRTATARHRGAAVHVKHFARTHGAGPQHQSGGGPAMTVGPEHDVNPIGTATAGEAVATSEAQAPKSTPAATAAPTEAATQAATAAPTADAPAVAVAPATVQLGDTSIKTPEIKVPLPQLPVAVPTVVLPSIKLP